MAKPPVDGLGRLTEAYESRGIVLVLGAGVSYDSHLPNWRDLMERVFEDLHGGIKLFPGLERITAPVLASLLEERTPSEGGGDSTTQRAEFAKWVWRALYRDFGWPLATEITRESAPRLVEMLESKNKTLSAVSAMCVRRGRDGFKPNPRVKAVVTFNLDNLLQAHSRAKYCHGFWASPRHDRGKALILRTVERASASSSLGKISVYHVHGSMRFDEGLEKVTKHAPDRIVLTEQDYFNVFNDPTSIFNYTLLYLLREYTAVFVGLSMEDENLRRLLHYSKLERATALRAEGVSDPGTIRGEVQRHVALLKRTSSEADHVTEDTLRPLGVHVIWMADFEEIPTTLAPVYATAGESWESVYG